MVCFRRQNIGRKHNVRHSGMEGKQYFTALSVCSRRIPRGNACIFIHLERVDWVTSDTSHNIVLQNTMRVNLKH